MRCAILHYKKILAMLKEARVVIQLYYVIIHRTFSISSTSLVFITRNFNASSFCTLTIYKTMDINISIMNMCHNGCRDGASIVQSTDSHLVLVSGIPHGDSFGR